MFYRPVIKKYFPVLLIKLFFIQIKMLRLTFLAVISIRTMARIIFPQNFPHIYQRHTDIKTFFFKIPKFQSRVILLQIWNYIIFSILFLKKQQKLIEIITRNFAQICLPFYAWKLYDISRLRTIHSIYIKNFKYICFVTCVMI